MRDSLPSQIVSALAEFPDQCFPFRDISRRFATKRKSYLANCLLALTMSGKISRRMSYGIFVYRAGEFDSWT